MFGGVERLLLRRTCAFSLVVVKVLFFPLYRRRAICTATHKSKALISLESFSSNLSFVLGGEGGVREEAQIFLKRTLSRLLRYFPLLLTTNNTNTKKRYIYIHNNAAFPRAIP